MDETLGPAPILMRSKNTRQLQVMIDRANETAAKVYREIRGDHTFYVSRRMPTRSSPCEYTYTTVRRIGAVLHRRVEYIRRDRDGIPAGEDTFVASALASPEKPMQ